jgi:hypothetical protein
MIFDISVLGLGDEVLNAFFDVGGAVDEFEVVLEQTFADDGADNEAEVVGPLLLLFGGVLEVVELGLDAVALPEEAALLGVETVQLGLGTLDVSLSSLRVREIWWRISFDRRAWRRRISLSRSCAAGMLG